MEINIYKKILDDDSEKTDIKLKNILEKMKKSLTKNPMIYGKSSSYIFISTDNIDFIKNAIKSGALDIFDVLDDDNNKIGIAQVFLIFRAYGNELTAVLTYIDFEEGFFNKDNVSNTIVSIKNYYKKMFIKHFLIDLPVEYKDFIEIEGGFTPNFIKEFLLD